MFASKKKKKKKKKVSFVQLIITKMKISAFFSETERHDSSLKTKTKLSACTFLKEKNIFGILDPSVI